MPRHTDNHWLETIAVTGIPITSGGGAGTQYTEDAASAADPVGNMLIGRRKDTLSASQVSADGDNIALNTTSKGELYVKQVDSQIVAGDVAGAATDSGNPVKVGAIYNSTMPTYTNAQRAELQTGTRGALRVELWASDANTPMQRGNDNGDGVSSSATSDKYLQITRNTVFNGTNWDRMRGSTTGGVHTSVAATPTVTTVSVATSSTSVLSSNTARKAMVLSNVGSNNIFINLAGGTAVTTNTLIVPNGTLVLDRWVPTTAITGIAVTGATNLSVTELA
jgi:hypothetical protein